MPRDTEIDTILATGTMGKKFRVLTVDITWPTGDPPYQPDLNGDVPTVTVPPLPPSTDA